MNPYLLFALRIMLGLIWLYNGLWLKVILLDAEHLAVVQGLGIDYLSPENLLRLIGFAETLLALGIWSGLLNRFVSIFQLAILVVMNSIGIVFSGAIAEPLGLLVQNLPMFFCIVIVAIYGAGFPFQETQQETQADVAA